MRVPFLKNGVLFSTTLSSASRRLTDGLPTALPDLPTESFALFGPLFDSGYYRRYLPKFVYVKSVLDSGAIGRVTSVSLRLAQSRHKFEGEEVRADWRVDATNAGGGLFMDLG